MKKRRIARELSLQMLYQIDVTKEKLEQSFISIKAAHNENLPQEIWDYAHLIASGTIASLSKIDQIIDKCSSKWDLERICLVDRNILRQAVYEMIYSPEKIPPSVCIDEAIEIAKKYSSNLAPAFVNGILDQIKGIET